jgi:hypothetical protein
MPSSLWLFAHRALSPQFHADPGKLVEMLDSNIAPALLERMWTWALSQSGATEPARPPLRYHIERPQDGLAVVAIGFTEVTQTGEPWQIRLIVRAPDPGGANGHARMFLLEHDAYATELAKSPTAIVCESCAGGRHVNWGETLPPDDTDGFDRIVSQRVREAAN